MISSFPKVNFFMSGWGLQGYRQKGVAFMPKALETRHPAFCPEQSPGFLQPDHLAFQRLLPQDREIIGKMYVPYWGPVLVAGARAAIPEDGDVEMRIPFPGMYRLEAEESVRIDGRLVDTGDVVSAKRRSLRVSRVPERMEMRRSVFASFFGNCPARSKAASSRATSVHGAMKCNRSAALSISWSLVGHSGAYMRQDP